MYESEIKGLLSKYIEESLTVEERHRFFSLAFSPENEQAFKEIILSHIEENQDINGNDNNTDFEKIYNKILSEINLNGARIDSGKSLSFRSRRNRILLSTIGIAASLVITFFLGALFTRTTISKLAGQAPVNTYTEIRTPFGSTSEIYLPDGSKVLLNAGSSLRYQDNFNKTNRDIFLTGEAYFRVSRNIDLPLIVNAGNINIRAVGTEFNIKAYDDEPVIETTLVEGKIEITRLDRDDNEDEFIDLNPNQTAIFIKETKSLTIKKDLKGDSTLSAPVKTLADNIIISPKVDVNEVAAWTHGKLMIREENLEDLCVKLQRKYDVTITFRDEEVKKFSFTGILLDETLEQVMDAIQLAAPIRYSIKGKIVQLSTDINKAEYFSKHLK